MTVFLVTFLVLGVLACLLAGVLSFDLYRSDAAGNGLTQAWLTIELGVTWLITAVAVIAVVVRAPHANCPAELPWTALSWAAVFLLAVAVAGQVIGLSALSGQRSHFTAWLQASVPLVPMAFLLHAAWRTGLPLPWQVATWGCAALVLAGSALSVAATARAASVAMQRRFDVVYPALLVQEREFVRVLRGGDQLQNLPQELVSRVREAIVIDANCATYALSGLHATGAPSAEGAVPVAFTIARNQEPLAFPAVCELVLGVECLHPDRAQDAEVRRLIGMQSSVTALTFVLPR